MSWRGCLPGGCLPMGVSAQGKGVYAGSICLGGCVCLWVSAQRGVCPGGCLPRRGVCPGVCLPRLGFCPGGGVCLGEGCLLGVYTSPREQTDTCKHITFPVAGGKISANLPFGKMSLFLHKITTKTQHPHRQRD